VTISVPWGEAANERETEMGEGESKAQTEGSDELPDSLSSLFSLLSLLFSLFRLEGAAR